MLNVILKKKKTKCNKQKIDNMLKTFKAYNS